MESTSNALERLQQSLLLASSEPQVAVIFGHARGASQVLSPEGGSGGGILGITLEQGAGTSPPLLNSMPLLHSLSRRSWAEAQQSESPELPVPAVLVAGVPLHAPLNGMDSDEDPPRQDSPESAHTLSQASTALNLQRYPSASSAAGSDPNMGMNSPSSRLLQPHSASVSVAPSMGATSIIQSNGKSSSAHGFDAPERGLGRRPQVRL